MSQPDKEFHDQFQRQIMQNTFYRGIQTYKNPIDAWVYQEIIHRTEPNIVIEIGNMFGGSALMFSDMMRNRVGHEHLVIGIDINQSQLQVSSPNIEWVEKDATKIRIEELKRLYKNFSDPRIMIVEDSAHDFDTTSEILKLYAPLVSLDCYFIVEDTIINQGLHRPTYGEHSAFDAVQTFVENESDQFEIDKSCERYGLSWNPSGYLKRIAL